MRKLAPKRIVEGVFVAAVIVVRAASSNDCGSSSFEIFPPRGEIPSNPMFVVQGDSHAGAALKSVRDEDILLGMEIDTVYSEYAVRIIERKDASVSRILFTPMKALPKGIVALRIRTSFGDGEPRWLDAGSWTVRGMMDSEAPAPIQAELTANVRLIPGSSEGDEGIIVEFPVFATESPVYWVASVSEGARGAPVGEPEEVYLLHKMPALSRGACGRNYPLRHGKHYVVDLTPIDAAGHRGKPVEQRYLVDVP